MEAIQARRSAKENPYFLLVRGQEQGPFSHRQLQAMLNNGEVSRNTLCAQEGGERWTPLSDVLFPAEPKPPVKEFTPSARSTKCPDCLGTVPTSARKCQHCGSRLQAAYVPEVTSPGAYAGASFIVIGLGQILLGQVGKGLLLMALAVAFGLVTIGIALLIIMPISAIDAYRVAQAIQAGRRVRPWEFFPE